MAGRWTRGRWGVQTLGSHLGSSVSPRHSPWNLEFPGEDMMMECFACQILDPVKLFFCALLDCLVWHVNPLFCACLFIFKLRDMLPSQLTVCRTVNIAQALAVGDLRHLMIETSSLSHGLSVLLFGVWCLSLEKEWSLPSPLLFPEALRWLWWCPCCRLMVPVPNPHGMQLSSLTDCLFVIFVPMPLPPLLPLSSQIMVDADLPLMPYFHIAYYEPALDGGNEVWRSHFFWFSAAVLMRIPIQFFNFWTLPFVIFFDGFGRRLKKKWTEGLQCPTWTLLYLDWILWWIISHALFMYMPWI